MKQSTVVSRHIHCAARILRQIVDRLSIPGGDLRTHPDKLLTI